MKIAIAEIKNCSAFDVFNFSCIYIQEFLITSILTSTSLLVTLLHIL